MKAANEKILGGVLYYQLGPRNGPCGQAMGADGSGSHILLINGTPEEAGEIAASKIRELSLSGQRVLHVDFVSNDSDLSYRNSIQEIRREKTVDFVIYDEWAFYDDVKLSDRLICMGVSVRSMVMQWFK